MIMPDEKVTNDEVKSWRGLHLLHFQNSTCSHKVRLILGELGLDWTGHSVNLLKQDNSTPWFLGINPRGVVPVLVHDGVVHVESNDIITYLDARYAKTGSSYFFAAEDPRAAEAQSLLDLEDSLHAELRLMSMQFGPIRPRSKEQIDAQENNGAFDEKRDAEVRWWRKRLEQGTSPDELREACAKFNEAFSRLDERVESDPWLMGERISIVDIAWYVNMQRLLRVGYPLSRHENLYQHYLKLAARPAFVAEARHPGSRVGATVFAACRLRNRLKGNRVVNYM